MQSETLPIVLFLGKKRRSRLWLKMMTCAGELIHVISLPS